MNEDLGTISLCYSVKYERSSRHSAERLWQAITSPGEVSKWMAYPVTIDLRPGGEFSMDFRTTGGGEMRCVICRIEPGRAFAYVFEQSVCEWTIEAADEGCRYTFVQSGLADRGEREEELAAGWHGFYDQLDEYLDGIPLDLEKHRARWLERLPAYRERLRAVLPPAAMAVND
jgi:uncharacterized protein YndB with AHSA1/START domain